MKMKLGACALLIATLFAFSARADVSGRHPMFLRALTDLRDAHWNLEHRPGDYAVRSNEEQALAETDRAISEIRQAAIDDGKNIADHPREDAHLDRAGRVHHALELLRKARNDASGEEDNPETRGLRHRALEHIEAAIHAAERAVYDLEHHHY